MKNSKALVEGEGVPLTQDLISQIYQLVDFLSMEESKLYCILTLEYFKKTSFTKSHNLQGLLAKDIN